MQVVLTPKYLDKDDYWKFSVSFVNGNSAGIHTYYYLTEDEVDAAYAKTVPSKDSLTDVSITSLKLENNAK